MAGRVLDPVECSLQPLDLAFHPTDEILAVGLVDGTVECKFHFPTNLFFIKRYPTLSVLTHTLNTVRFDDVLSSSF